VEKAPLIVVWVILPRESPPLWNAGESGVVDFRKKPMWWGGNI